jgi:methionine-rich copper-binding protein CopC
MPTVTKFPTSNAAVSGTWSNVTNAYASNGSVTSTTFGAKNTTVEHAYGTFGFHSDIPVGSTINSVAVNVRHRVSTTAGVVFLENLLLRAGTAGATNSNAGEPTALTVDTYSNYARPGGGSWVRDDLSDANLVARIRARSGNDATSVTYEWDYISVTVDYNDPDTTAPVVDTFNPASGATNINPAANIVLTFNEAIQRGTGTITLRSGSASGTIIESFDAAASGRISISGSTFTLDPTSNLADTTTYFVVFPSGSVQDTSGNNWAGTSAYSFVTGDYTAPVVDTFSPASGSTGAAPSSNIVLTFSESVARGTGTITIRSGSASGTIFESFNAATSDRITISGATFTLDPTTTLADSTLYFVVFPSGSVRDTSVNANNWTGTSSYSFTTGVSDVTFPSSPTTGQTFTYQGRKWEYTGTAWERPLVSRLGDTMSGYLTARVTEFVEVVSANTNAVASTAYVLTGSLTLTLPSSPAAGAWVRVSNRSGATTCVIARNGQPIMGLAENLTVDVVDAGFTLTYADATRGWVIL